MALKKIASETAPLAHEPTKKPAKEEEVNPVLYAQRPSEETNDIQKP